MDEAAAWDAVAGFITTLALEKGLADNSREAYQRDLGDLIRFAVQEKLKSWAAVKTADISNYILELYDLGVAPSTVNRRLASFRGFFNHLMREGLLTANPAEFISGPRSHRPLPVALSIPDMERLLDAPDLTKPAGVRDRAMLEVGYGCGLRVSELVGLRLENFKMNGEVLRITGKGDKQRLVPVGEFARKSVIDYLEQVRPGLVREPRKAGDAVFLTLTRGAPMTRQMFWTLFKRYALKAGITAPVKPHTLRHTFATHLIEGGAGLREVQELLGHSSINTTMIYTEIDRAHLFEVVKTFHPRG